MPSSDPRHRLDLFNFSTEVRVRLPETDAMGIVFHGYFFTFMEVGRMDYLRNLGLAEHPSRPIRSFANVVREATCEFLSPARFDDPLIIHVRIPRIGRTSFPFEFLIRHKKANRNVAFGRSVHVAIADHGDEGGFSPMEVPPSFREIIATFEGETFEGE